VGLNLKDSEHFGTDPRKHLTMAFLELDPRAFSIFQDQAKCR